MAYRVEITLRLPISLVFRIVSSLGVSELLSLSLLATLSYQIALSATIALIWPYRQCRFVDFWQ